MKRKGHLAVFENISEGTSNKNQNEDEEDEDDSFGDEEMPKLKIKKRKSRLCDVPKQMICKYLGCSKEFSDYFKFNQHLVGHIKEQEQDFESSCDNLVCEYGDCEIRLLDFLHALQHISFHGYMDQLMNLGAIVARRDSLPDCKVEFTFNYSMQIETYACEWEECRMICETYCDFLFHVKMHVNCNPKSAASIKCKWKDCTKSFTNIHPLYKHMPVHTKEKYIACPTCGNTFASMVRYCNHRKKQLPIGKQNYKCSQCSKLFATENLLRDHVRSHINQYKCSLCDMTCPKPSNLATHMRYRHLNERPFKCNLCDHASITKQNLEMHLITHCAEKLLACDECDFKCRSMHGLDRHIQREHGQNYGQTFGCHLCQKLFKRGAYLTRHLIKAHGMQWPSGHSRFRYKEDPDGICRLQTIRYETVDVIKEILKSKSESPVTSSKTLNCRIIKKKIDEQLSVEVKIEEAENDSSAQVEPKCDQSNVELTISDLDEKGNVITQVTESQEVICKEEIIFDDDEDLIKFS